MLIVLAFHPVNTVFYFQKCVCLYDNLATLSVLILESEKGVGWGKEQNMSLDEGVKKDNLFSWEPGTTQFSLDSIEAIDF